jgi:hypothetical protein
LTINLRPGIQKIPSERAPKQRLSYEPRRKSDQGRPKRRYLNIGGIVEEKTLSNRKTVEVCYSIRLNPKYRGSERNSSGGVVLSSVMATYGWVADNC